MDTDRATTPENVMSTAGHPEILQGRMTELGISLTDTKREFCSTYDIIRDMAKVWEEQGTGQ